MVFPLNGATPAVMTALSHPRLSNYRAFFSCADDDEALGLYLWNEELSAGLYRAFSTLEVVMRNQFHRALSARYGVNGSPASRDWYLHLRLTPMSMQKIQELLSFRKRVKGAFVWVPRTPVPRPDDVVSKLTFGFWQHLFDVTHDTSGAPVGWGDIIPDIVPGHRQKQSAYWRQQIYQDELFARIDLCKELRNRVAHHEPVWKFGELLEERRERQHRPPRTVLEPSPTTPGDALRRLSTLYGRAVELMSWISPAASQLYSTSENHARCQALLADRCLDHYRQRRMPSTVDLKRIKGGRDLRQLVQYATRKRQPLHLKVGDTAVGNLVCPG